MTTLVYEDVALKKNSLDRPYDTAEVELRAFLKANEKIVREGATLRFSLCLIPLTVARTSSVSNSEALAKLIITNAPQIPTWEEGELSFDFGSKMFLRKGVSLHLTAKEQLVLYKRLLRGERQFDGYPQVKAQLKKKFGKDFLKEYL